jgi:60 kDa SS-A/Ro ribonucleoprotein
MRFNLKTKKEQKVVVNYEGALAFELTPQMELYSLVATTSLSDQFYEKNTDKLDRLRTLIAKNNPAYVAKLAIYAREQMHLRSIALVLAVELAKQQSGNSLVGQLVGKVVQRADELTELLAFYAIANERNETKKLNKLSKQLQKGLATSFNKFDEYQFAKYNKDASIKLKDVLFLVHPKAKDEAQQVLFNKIASDELKSPYTWEVELSAIGQVKYTTEVEKKETFKAKWEELIYSNKMGYMATMRNLRNILEAEISNKALDKVCMYLSNETAVLNSKQLPFRFLAAYRELKVLTNGNVSKVLTALEQAVQISARNIQGFDADTKVLIATDVSGSMQKAINAKSKIMYYDIGLILAMLLQSRCENVITAMFGDTWKVINMPKQNILSNVQEFYNREGEVGYATNGYLVIDDLIKKNKVVDKLMFFTDCQLYNSNNTSQDINVLWKTYKTIAPNAKLYLFDLAGYRNSPLRIEKNDVFLIAGWSDKIFQVLHAIENGTNAVGVIENTEL